jgi:predicted glycoside hydrolase/deacetylase ChbG (UPF0249 family)
MKRLIITADDFGASPEVNRAVESHHREGVLTRAGLMVEGKAVEGALDIARRNPALRIGLHLVLAENRPAWNGIRWVLSPGARRQMEADLARQFRRFIQLGLRPTWWDGHFHLHLHPLAMAAAISVARGVGFSQVRLVRHHGGGGPAAAISGLLAKAFEPALATAGIGWVPRVFGLGFSGNATTHAVERLLRTLPDGLSELYCHPGAESAPWDFPRIRRAMEAGGIALTDGLDGDQSR